MVKERKLGLDIVRFFAIFFVISVHFFLKNGFYGVNLKTFSDFIALFFRELFYTCVPLFLILTGYLNGHQKFSKNYVYKIVKILISYFLIGIVCLLFQKYFLLRDFSKLQIFVSFFNFTAVPYGWYVEMYVGLFFFIPFFNIIYDNIKNKKHKGALLLILIFFTACSSLTNSVVFHGVTMDFVPDYWVSIFPITYYFLGRFLKEYPLKISTVKKVVILILTLLIQAIGIFIYSYNKYFVDVFFGGYGCIFTVIATTMILSILADRDIKNKIGRKIVSSVSLVAFEMYLISFVFDSIIYPYIVPIKDSSDYLIYYFICVPFVFICSFFSALIINKITTFLYKKLRPTYDKLCNMILKA